jgi:general secretion pathway protein H
MLKIKTVKGFTLIEILLVVFIIAIVASFMVLRLAADNSNATNAHEYSEKILQKLNYARELSISKPVEIGVLVRPNELSFLYFIDASIWIPVDDENQLKPINFTRNVNVQLNIENKNTTLNATTPQIIVFSSGEVTPFILRINEANTFAEVINDTRGLRLIQEVAP